MEEKYITLLEYVKKQISNFALVKKSDSFLMNIISFFFKSFKNYTTTLYPKVYVEEGYEENLLEDKIEIVAHEYVHLKDRKNWGAIIFNLLYLTPQLCAILFLLSFFSLWFLLFLLFLLPIPSIGRSYIEYRGYVMSIAVYYWLCKEKYDMEWIVNQFAGSGYYFMFPFKKYLRNKLEKEFEKIQRNEFSFQQLQEVYDILNK